MTDEKERQAAEERLNQLDIELNEERKAWEKRFNAIRDKMREAMGVYYGLSIGCAVDFVSAFGSNRDEDVRRMIVDNFFTMNGELTPTILGVQVKKDGTPGRTRRSIGYSFQRWLVVDPESPLTKASVLMERGYRG